VRVTVATFDKHVKAYCFSYTWTGASENLLLYIIFTYALYYYYNNNYTPDIVKISGGLKTDDKTRTRIGYKSGMFDVKASYKSTELKRCITTEIRWNK